MKKIMSLLMALAMLMGSLPALAEAAPVQSMDVPIGEDMWLNSSAWLDGRVYMGNGREYYAYTPGEESIKTLEMKAQQAQEEEDGFQVEFVADTSRLYGVNLQKGMIYPLTVEGDALTAGEGLAIDTKPLRNMEYGEEGYVETPMQMLIEGGRLYLVNRTWDMDGEETLSLCSYDIEKGGGMKSYEAQFVWRIVPYKDGKMLALVADPAKAWNRQEEKYNNFSLALWDPERDTMEEFGDAGVQFDADGLPIAYDAQTDYLYMQGRSEIWRRDAAGEVKIAAYLVPNNYGGQNGDQLFILGPGRILSVAGKNIMLREADPEKLPAVRLTIFGGGMDDAHQKAISAMGGLPITFLNDKWFESAQQLGQALVTGEDNIDILSLSADYMDLDNLMSKGYAADLSENAALTAYADQVYPFMKEAGMHEGRLYMVPVRVSDDGLMGYYPKLFERLGMEVPATFLELVELIQTWNDEMTEEYSEFIPLLTEDYRQTLLHRAIRMQMAISAAQGREFQFSDPDLKKMMEAVLALNTEDIAPKIDWEADPAEAEEQMNELYNRTPLIDDYFSLNLQSLSREMFGFSYRQERQTENGTIEIGKSEPLLLSAVEGGAKEPVRLYLQMMFVNPKSRHPEEAAAYLAEYVKHLAPDQLAKMMPGMNEDIENPNYERDMENFEEGLCQYEKQIKEAEGAEKTEIEKGYEQYKKFVEAQREEGKYLARKEAIAYYRELIENSVVLKYEQNMAVYNQDIYPLITRLVQGQIKLDQFASEADGKLRLMRLENQ